MELLSSIIRWSLSNRAVVLLGALVFVFFGVRAATLLPIDAVPDITNVQVQILTTAPALSPVEIEQYVTVPVERAMAGIPRLTEIRSVSKYGISAVTIVFSDDTNIYFARQLVAERMREAEDAVPPEYGRPSIGPITSGLGEVYQFVLRGEGHSLMELQETLDFYVSPQLRLVPGVVEVNSQGGEARQYQVVVDPTRLQASSLSIGDVVRALERSNSNAGGGYIERNREQLLIGSVGQVKSLDDVRTVVLGATSDGVPITIANIGDVRFGPKLRRGAASMNGEGEVAVGVALMLLGENSRTVTEAVKQRLAALAPTLPEGMHIEPFYDRSVLVNRTIHTVVKNLSEGALLVILVLFVLLGDLRAGLIVATTIPLAMLFALLLMNATGASGNLMSLGAIDFGLIVDAAVIIVENAVRRLGEARRRKGSALDAQERIEIVRDSSVEVRSASVFGEMIIAVVYIPILALRGIEGKLFHPMATTVLFALVGAFLCSLTVVPVLTSLFIRPDASEHETWLMRKLHAVFTPVMHASLRHRGRVLAGGLATLVFGALLLTRVGAEFVPQLDEGDILVEARRLPGVSLSESNAIQKRMERAIRAIPEVSIVVSRTGSPEIANDVMGIDQSDVYVGLKEPSTWRKGVTKAALTKQIADAVDDAVPEAARSMSQPIQMRTNELVAGVHSDVAASIYGSDLAQLEKLGEQVASVVRRVPGVADVHTAASGGLSYLHIVPDRARLARYGLTIEDVNLLTETLAVGRSVGKVFEADRRFGMVVKMPITEVEQIRSLPLKSSTGQVVPLGDVADVRLDVGPAQVLRDHQSRRITVEFNVRGRDLVSVVTDAQAAVNAQLTPPAGYRVEWGGEFENYLSARKRLLLVVPVSLVLILFMLWLAFEEVRPAALIFLNIPFAIVGGVAALWLRGLPFSVSAGVGFIALFGVAVLNGLVLVSFARHLQAQGRSPHDAVGEAVELRLRPVLTTALVAALGFIPMALSTSPGSEVQRPLATVVIGGLFTATALTLLLFPAVYSLAHRRTKKQLEVSHGP